MGFHFAIPNWTLRWHKSSVELPGTAKIFAPIQLGVPPMLIDNAELFPSPGKSAAAPGVHR